MNTKEERRWQQTNDRGVSALSAALLADPEGYPQPDDHIAALDQEQRDELETALRALLDIVDGMRGAA